MADLSVTIRITPPNALDSKAIHGAIARGLKISALHLEGKAKDNITPFTKTGRLRSSITHKVTGLTATIGSKVDYAPYVEYGTKPHVIVPKTKKALKFGNVYAMRVNHPGFKGHHYMERTLKEGRNDVVRIIEAELRRAIP